MAHFEVYKDARGEFRWRFRADNGRILADGAEGYKAKADCEYGVELVRQKAAGAAVQDRTADPPSPAPRS
jgi:uncharacterized protein YegP (UPF0339 family)